MSNFVVALLAAIGSGGWVYSKVAHRSGGNMQTVWIATGVCATVVFIVMFTLMSLIIH